MFKSVEKFGNHGENPFAYFETKKFKDAVQRFEECQGILAQHKVSILATALDLKPATKFDFLGDSKEKQEIVQILSDLGLFFSVDKDLQTDHKTHFQFTIGSTSENISEGMLASVKDEEHFGTSMGFPETAVHAYDEARQNERDELLLPQEKYKEVLTPDEEKFLFFRLSRDNYAKEIEWVEQIIAATKKYAPELYEEVMNSRYS